MRMPALVLASALPLVAALDRVGAQTILPGEWSGMLSWCCAREGRPGVAAVVHRLDARYYVTVKGNTVAARGRFTSPHTGDGLALSLNDMKVIGDTLTFWASDDDRSAAERVGCTLIRRDDGAFEGPCKTRDENNTRMLMIPPRPD